MALPTKQYGLILSQKKGAKNAMLQRPSVFGDDSDDETSVGESLQKEAIKKKMMKQTRIEMQKALDQDSTVYDYDSVYDDIQKERLESNKKILGGADKKPKYIHQLMKAVEDRKKEQERRDERKIQKEREAEGEQFADKESYVTSAYKQKLLEQKEEQERESREAAMEAALDVKKQQDLSGFYRHLLNQTVGEEAIPDRSAIKTPKVPEDAEQTSPVTSPTSRDNIPSSGSDNEEEQEQKTGFSKPTGVSAHSKRQYRQRSPSSESGEEKERQKERDRHKKSHRDRGRDRDRERDRDKNRGRERDDRHGEKRSDRDRRKDRDRGRDDRDRTREDRHGKRERSPKEREREKNGDREKRRNSDEDKRKERSSEKGVIMEEKEVEKKDAPEEPSKQKEDGERKEGQEKADAEENASKFAKRSTDQTVTSARERYMARQMARSACKSYVEKEED